MRINGILSPAYSPLVQQPLEVSPMDTLSQKVHTTLPCMIELIDSEIERRFEVLEKLEMPQELKMLLTHQLNSLKLQVQDLQGKIADCPQEQWSKDPRVLLAYVNPVEVFLTHCLTDLEEGSETELLRQQYLQEVSELKTELRAEL